MTGIELISMERQRQIDEEGYTVETDQRYQLNQLSFAAISYLLTMDTNTKMPLVWPWTERYWKPEDRIKNLIKAGSLIAAEIDRLQNLIK